MQPAGKVVKGVALSARYHSQGGKFLLGQEPKKSFMFIRLR